MPEKFSAPIPVHPVDFFKQSKIAIWRATVDETGHCCFAVPHDLALPCSPDFAGSGYPSIAALTIDPEIDVMCQIRHWMYRLHRFGGEVPRRTLAYSHARAAASMPACM